MMSRPAAPNPPGQPRRVCCLYEPEKARTPIMRLMASVQPLRMRLGAGRHAVKAAEVEIHVRGIRLTCCL